MVEHILMGALGIYLGGLIVIAIGLSVFAAYDMKIEKGDEYLIFSAVITAVAVFWPLIIFCAVGFGIGNAKRRRDARHHSENTREI